MLEKSFYQNWWSVENCVNKSHRDPFQCCKDAAKSNAAENADTNENELKKITVYYFRFSFICLLWHLNLIFVYCYHLKNLNEMSAMKRIYEHNITKSWSFSTPKCNAMFFSKLKCRELKKRLRTTELKKFCVTQVVTFWAVVFWSIFFGATFTFLTAMMINIIKT